MQKRVIIKLGMLGLIFLAVFAPLDHYYDRYYRENLDLCDKAKWVLGLQDENFQDAFIGSSRAFNMLDLVGYSERTKRTAINLATSGSGFGENYLLLQQFVANGNTLDRLVIQVDIYSLDAEEAYSYSFHSYKYMPWLAQDSVSRIVRDHNPLKYWIWRYVPFAKYMEFNQHYDFYKTLRGGFTCTDAAFIPQLGSLLREDAEFKNFKEKSVQSYSFNSLDWTYFQRMVQFAMNNGIEVVLYQAPEMADYLSHQLNRDALLERYEQYADHQRLPFYRFEDLPLTRDRDNFRDFTHLNKAGSILFTKVLEEKLVEGES